jgi:hypothetical protein
MRKLRIIPSGNRKLHLNFHKFLELNQSEALQFQFQTTLHNRRDLQKKKTNFKCIICKNKKENCIPGHEFKLNEILPKLMWIRCKLLCKKQINLSRFKDVNARDIVPGSNLIKIKQKNYYLRDLKRFFIFISF